MRKILKYKILQIPYLLISVEILEDVRKSKNDGEVLQKVTGKQEYKGRCAQVKS